jgi:HEAT repeat protein
MLKTLSPALLALLLLSPAPSSLVAVFTADEAEIVAELTEKRDDADPELFGQLAEMKSHAAAEGLVEGYDSMSSIFMRLQALEALVNLDGVAEAEQIALQKLMDVAVGSDERELRDVAIRSLGKCRSKGRAFLRMIIESAAEDDVRIDAMERHIAMSSEEDHEWYRELYEDDGKKDPGKSGGRKPKKRRGRKDEDAPKELLVHKLGVNRELAFGAIVNEMAKSELVGAVEDRNAGIRRIALKRLGEKHASEAARHAEDVFGHLEERSANRIVAAEILLMANGASAARDFIKTAEAFITPMELRLALADLLLSLGDEKLNKTMAKRVGKGKAHEKHFYLHVARGLDDPKLTKTIAKMLKDKEFSVAIAAAEALLARKDETATKALESALKKAKDPLMVSACVLALDGILAGDEDWEVELMEYVNGEDAVVRNAALGAVAARGQDHIEFLYRGLSHADWSTRLVALDLLAKMKVPASVGRMIAQMKGEEGRMLHEFADVLFELTGQPFRTRWGNWNAWWTKEGADFKPISRSDLRKRRKEEDERRLRQITAVKFFGIRIISHRVIFIIDVSGSMNEPTRAEYVGEQGEPRIAVAQRELKRCIEGLDSKALFNILTFSGGVDSWLEDGVTDSGARSRDEAREYVDRLGAMGGTNLYGALRQAFEDPDVDTIFVLSDGEPSAGDVIDPFEIRGHVKRWNKERDIVINAIAVGGSFEVLEWIAEDSGGTHVRFN